MCTLIRYCPSAEVQIGFVQDKGQEETAQNFVCLDEGLKTQNNKLQNASAQERKIITAQALCAHSVCSCPCLFRLPLYPHRDRKKLLSENGSTPRTLTKRATGMCLTAARISNFDACVAVCFLQAMEAHNSPPWMCTGGNM